MATTRLLTIEEFLALDWPENGSLELVRGEVVYVPSAGTPHNWTRWQASEPRFLLS